MIIMPNPDGTPREGDKRNVNGNVQVFHNHRWHSSDEQQFNTEQFMAQQGAVRPKDIAPPKRSPPKTLGTGSMIGKPWNYKSPQDYLLAYATRPAKTKAGKFMFNTFNTLSWITDYYKGKAQSKASEEQSKAVNEGFETALKNVNSWLGDIDPSTDIDFVPSSKINQLYREIGKKESELAEQYQACKGKTDPESLRIKSEYKVYADMYAKMDADLQKQRFLREQAKAKAEQAQRQEEQSKLDNERKEELRRKAEERRRKLNQDNNSE